MGEDMACEVGRAIDREASLACLKHLKCTKRYPFCDTISMLSILRC